MININSIKKGYIDIPNIIMTNKKFNNFEYLSEDESLKECRNLHFLWNKNLIKLNIFNNFSEELVLKINVIEFYEYLKLLNKLNIKEVIFESLEHSLILKGNKQCFKIDCEIQSLYPSEKDKKSKYNINYILNFLKQFNIKELKEEFFIYLYFLDDYPILIKFKEDWGILAPIID
jgi:hypothetical protein